MLHFVDVCVLPIVFVFVFFNSYQEYVEHHLRTSSYHYITDESLLEELCAGFVWEERQWDPSWGPMPDEEDESTAEGSYGAAVGKGGKGGQGCKGPYGKAGKRGQGMRPSSSTPDLDLLTGAVGQLAATVAAAVQVSAAPTQAPPSSTLSLSSSTLSLPHPPTTQVTRATVATLCENMDRAERALQAASRVATGAAQSFSMECANLQACKAELERILRTMP